MSPNKKRTPAAQWVVVANRTSAVFYLNGSDQKFHFVGRLSNKKGRRTDHELVADRPGRVFASGGGSLRHALEAPQSRKEHIAHGFAGRIAATLDEGLRLKRFKTLVLVAEPRFLGMLREELHPDTRRSVIREVGHEYARGSDERLRELILQSSVTAPQALH